MEIHSSVFKKVRELVCEIKYAFEYHVGLCIPTHKNLFPIHCLGQVWFSQLMHRFLCQNIVNFHKFKPQIQFYQTFSVLHQGWIQGCTCLCRFPCNNLKHSRHLYYHFCILSKIHIHVSFSPLKIQKGATLLNCSGYHMLQYSKHKKGVL